jgi:hypothetical protein
VKGAYWDYETIKAKANGWPIPVWQKKWQSDANFEACTRFALQNTQHLRPALGSHNLRSLAHGLATAQMLELPPAALELQMLYGMADAEKQAIVERGQRLRIYMLWRPDSRHGVSGAAAARKYVERFVPAGRLCRESPAGGAAGESGRNAT